MKATAFHLFVMFILAFANAVHAQSMSDKNCTSQTSVLDSGVKGSRCTIKLPDVEMAFYHVPATGASGVSQKSFVLIHGFPQHAGAWKKVIPLLAKEGDVIAVDLRGFGTSSAPAAGYDRKTMAGDVAAVIRAAGLKKPVVIGHDWGGSTAFSLAAHYPDILSALVVVDAVPQGPWLRNDATYREAWFSAFHRIADLPETLTRDRETEYIGWFFKAFSAGKPVFTPAEVDDFTKQFKEPQRMQAGFALYRGINKDLNDHAPFEKAKIATPCLAIGADQGLGQRVIDNLRIVCRSTEGVMMQNTTHFVPDEKPQELVDAVLGFLRGLKQR